MYTLVSCKMNSCVLISIFFFITMLLCPIINYHSLLVLLTQYWNRSSHSLPSGCRVNYCHRGNVRLVINTDAVIAETQSYVNRLFSSKREEKKMRDNHSIIRFFVRWQLSTRRWRQGEPVIARAVLGARTWNI